MKKNHILAQNKLFALVWALFHSLILATFVLLLATSKQRLSIDADLFNMLPSSTLGPALSRADKRLSESTARSVIILVSHQDFSRAKECAEEVFAALEGNPHFTSLSLYASTDDTLLEMEDFVHKWRFRLLDEALAESLLQKDAFRAREAAQSVADSALSTAYSAFTLSSLGHLEEDPFLLEERELRNYLSFVQDSGTALSPKDGVLASLYDGLWYVMLRGTLSREGAAIASKNNGITSIYAVCTPLEKDGIRFVYSGTPFHSHYSSNSAMSEVALISSLSLTVVIVLLLVVFSFNLLPTLASVFSILLSSITAFGATHIVFGKIHILTLVLGTSLIGSCIDYSLHFFINWKAASPSVTSGKAIRTLLFKGLFLSLISTEICYLMLIFAPFNLLKQMGVFSFVGILSSFLSVICMYPLFPLPAPEKRTIPLLKYYTVPKASAKRSIFATAALLLVTLSIITIYHTDVRIKNDMTHLYTMQGRLKDDTIRVSHVTKYNPRSWFIVQGATEESVLTTEEALCAQLAALNESAYLATSRFIPSLQTQEKSLLASRALEPLAQEQLELLGFEEESVHTFNAGLLAAGKNPLTIETALQEAPESIFSLIDMLWLGNIEGAYYSVVLLTNIQADAPYERIAQNLPGVYYENKMQDLNKGLDRLTANIFMLFALAYVVILIVLMFFYRWSHVLKIASIPLLSVLVIISVFMLTKNSIEFFSLTGIILVFGLGLDYIIYMIENSKRLTANPAARAGEAKREPFAILLSFVTTSISFGALALSSFVPVHIMGLTIFLGLVTAFVCTLF